MFITVLREHTTLMHLFVHNGDSFGVKRVFWTYPDNKDPDQTACSQSDQDLCYPFIESLDTVECIKGQIILKRLYNYSKGPQSVFSYTALVYRNTSNYGEKQA